MARHGSSSGSSYALARSRAENKHGGSYAVYGCHLGDTSALYFASAKSTGSRTWTGNFIDLIIIYLLVSVLSGIVFDVLTTGAINFVVELADVLAYMYVSRVAF
jgi:hypothetical protein